MIDCCMNVGGCNRQAAANHPGEVDVSNCVGEPFHRSTRKSSSCGVNFGDVELQKSKLTISHSMINLRGVF